MLKLIKINKQDGFASITIAIVLIVVLALITLGFAQLARREQQAALNKQLAAQANYAAESGINDVQNYIKAHPDADLARVFDNPNGCLDLAPFTNTITGNVDTSRDVKYSCVIVDPEPKDIGARVNAWSSWTTTFEAEDISKLDIIWKSTGNKAPKGNMASLPEFQTIDNWNSAPAVLQVSITPLSSASRDSFVKRTFTTYMYPTTTTTFGNSKAYSEFTALKGEVVSGSCDSSTKTCKSSITDLPGTGAYLLRVVGYYDTSNVTVKGYKAQGGQEVAFKDSQAKIDVTGKARNVLKRLQARIPLNNVGAYNLPNYAIEAKNVCKRIETTPTGTKYVPASNMALGEAGADNPCNMGDE